jgi:hypothetical protein
MSELRCTRFGADSATAKDVYLCDEGEALLTAWRDVALTMSKTHPGEFSRNEWAYLIHFAGSSTLRPVLESTFGPMQPQSDNRSSPARYAYIPRGECVVWLPNNVTLLGPLTVILLSLSGIRTTIKVGNRSDDLTTLWIDWLRQNCTSSRLSRWLSALTVIRADRSDPALLRASAEADVRIMFGSDETAEAIEGMPHRVGAQSFYFRDRSSQAWVDLSTFSDADVETLIRVFAIFGQMGCTSPQRVTLIGAGAADTRTVRDRIVRAWPTVEAAVPTHLASSVIATTQLARALGWNAESTHGNCATVACGAASLPPVHGVRCLTVVGCEFDDALAHLPSNVQTIGIVALHEIGVPWTEALIERGVDRIVPLGRMHHFGPAWDGMEFWRNLFRVIELP